MNIDDPAFETAAIGDFATEKQLLRGMKRTYLALTDRIVDLFDVGAAGEQEILLALADAAIQIFALESAVLRAEKISAAATERKQELYRAVVTLCTFTVKQHFVNAAEKCAMFLGDGSLLDTMGTVTAYKATGLLAAERLIADATSQAEKYIF